MDTIFKILALSLGTSLAVAASAADAAADFSTASNPNGVWSYGYSTALTGSMILDTATGTSGPLVSWLGNIAGDGNPAIVKNTSNANYSISSVTWLPNQMIMHPGPGGEYSIVRYTSTSAGIFAVAADFIGQDSTTTDVHLLLNGVSIFDSTITGYGSMASTAFPTLALLAGDKLDLRVGYGGNGFNNDSTGANLTVAPVPEPASMAVLGLGALGFLKRRKKS